MSDQVLKRLGIIATGDEIINGDILNTNGQYIANKCVANGIPMGRQVTVSDDPLEIEQAIQYLMTDHSVIITIGGLGPTSDDLTRFALANALSRPLEFHPGAWQWIVDLISSKGLDIPNSNRQQALLPANSELIHNPNGTAAACYIQQNDCHFFMLPGPPNECLPIIDEIVLPRLIAQDIAIKQYRSTWLLFSVSESSIANQLEPLLEDSNCKLGFRVDYPYLEVKLWSLKQDDLSRLQDKINPLFEAQVVSHNRQTGAQQLQHYLENTALRIKINDQSTHGSLEATLYSPQTAKRITFEQNEETADIYVEITGLEKYWDGSHNKQSMPLSVKIRYNNQIKTIDKDIPYRDERSIVYATELTCLELVNYLLVHDNTNRNPTVSN